MRTLPSSSTVATPLFAQQVAYPVFATVAGFCDLTGLGKTTVYEMMAAGHLQAVKAGSRTLIEVQPGLDYLRSLPPANVRLPKTMARKHAA
jgi:excisionase family DNA binding protein